MTRYEPHCDCLGGHVSMLPDPNGRWCRADAPHPVATQPALGYDPDCPECKGTGQRDSGGTHPWGEPAMMMCDCDAPPPAAPTDNTALVEDHICELNRAMNGECMTCGSIDQAMAQEQRQADLRHAALANREAPPACQPVEEWDHCTCGPCPLHPAPADREALVRFLQIITRNGSLDDGRTLHEVIADAMLARGLHDLKGGSDNG